jgi:hypothetical protein
MRHREVYAAFRRILDEEAHKPFRLMDLACGDASATAVTL